MIKLDLTGTTPDREIRAGLTTFAAMAYIVVVNPLILADAGMPREAVVAATCLAAAFGSILMGLSTNYPFAIAPGMGLSWLGALAAVFWYRGVVFLALTLTGLREAVLNAIPLSLKSAISVGIGLFIALIGLKNAGVVDHNPVIGSLGLVHAGYFADPELGKLLPFGASEKSVGLALFELVLTGALLIGIAVCTLLGVVQPGDGGLVGWPSGLGQTFLALDFAEVLTFGLVTVVITFTFVDLLDTVGTLVGVSRKAGLLDSEGRLPRAKRALFADSLATVFGASVGTSTTTTYVESAAGVAVGGRSGLTAVVAGVCFLLALFLAPLLSLLPAAAATAPALVIVGVFTMEPVRRIDFADYFQAIPAFFAVVLMPWSFSIAAGVTAFAAIHSCGRAWA